MSHPPSIAIALLITFAAVGDASAGRRVNFSPAKFFCGLVKSCETQRNRTHTKRVARKPKATRAPVVAKAEPAPGTLPAAVAATTELAPQLQPPPEAERTATLPTPIPVPRPIRPPPEVEQTAALLAPIPVPRPIRPPLAEPNAAAPAAAAAVLPPAAAVMSNSAMPDRQKIFERRESYRELAKAEALRQGVPFPLVDAVMKVESGYDPSALGAAGEIGLMQLMPETAGLLGFQGTAFELAEPAVNIALGTTYLARAWSLAKQDVCTAVMKYRAGHGESRFSELSVSYCERVRAHLLASGFPVTGSLPKVDLVPEPSVAATGADRPGQPRLMVPEFSELAEFGNWISYKNGHVWLPRNTTADWRPYTVGRWAFTKRYGWVWVSDEPFGWATYHYGRWGYERDIGWYWVQGSQWAPAWVYWGRSSKHVAWAPIPPPGAGTQVSESIDCCPIPFDRWTAVPIGNFLDRDVSNVVVRDAIKGAQPIGSVWVNDGTVVNKAFDVASLEQQTRSKVPIYDVRLTDNAAEMTSGLLSQLVIFRPERLTAGAANAPRKVEKAEEPD